MQQFNPLRKGGINKHVSIINVFTNASNLEEMKFSAFGSGQETDDFVQLRIIIN